MPIVLSYMIAHTYLQLILEQANQRSLLEQLVTRQEKDILTQEHLNTILIEESNEEIVKLADYIDRVIIDMKSRRKRFPQETLYSRKTVAEELSKISQEIAPDRIKVFDAFRPIQIQQQWFDDVYRDVAVQNPSWNAEQIYQATILCIFPPSVDLRMPPPHSTGAALDLTITTLHGTEMDMGTDYAQFTSPQLFTNAKGISSSQRAKCVQLLRLMGSHGFVNYPGEWWHFFFGDRDWVAYTGLPLPAIYGRVHDPCKMESV